MHSAKFHLFQRKLTFLRRQVTTSAPESNTIGTATTKALADNLESLCLVKECRELDSLFSTNLTNDVLTETEFANLTEMKKTIRKIDREQVLEKCIAKAPLIAQVVRAGGSWPRLWDCVLHGHLGSKHLKGLQNLTRVMAHHGQGSKPCPLCNSFNTTQPLIEHIFTQHHDDLGLTCISVSSISTDKLLNLLVDCDIRFVHKLWTLYIYVNYRVLCR